MVIVDTTVWVDYFRGIVNPETDWLDVELDRQRLGLTDIILCEVLQGVRDEAAASDVERRLLKLEVFESGGIALSREARAEFSPPAEPRSNGAEDDRLPHRHVLHPGAALAAAPRSRLRFVRDVSRTVGGSRVVPHRRLARQCVVSGPASSLIELNRRIVERLQLIRSARSLTQLPGSRLAWWWSSIPMMVGRLPGPLHA